jgi:DNA-binding GntR family transcriptional regulator
VARITLAELAEIGSWAVLERLGHTPARTEQSISAAMATRAEGGFLQAKPPLALLMLRRIGYDPTGGAVALTDHRYPGGRVRLSATYLRPHFNERSQPTGVSPTS